MKRFIHLVPLALTSLGVSSLTYAAEDHSKHAQPAQATHEQHNRDASDESDSASSSAQSDAAHAQHDPHAGHAMQTPKEPTESERAHVPPDPPKNPLGDMSEERMIELMEMEDNAPYSFVLLDQLEWREIDGQDAQVWEFQAFYGTDYNKIWFESEGERVDGEEEGRVELMWDRIISTWWSLQTGVRQDFGEGPSRTWADIGIQGLAPYFFEVDAGLYIGEQGRTAARFSGEYDMLITQRLILQPEIEFQLYGKDDPENGIGSGLSDVEAGLRLRYEIRREFAPYIGIHWERKFGQTADLARAQGEDERDFRFVAGLRAWF